MTNPEQILKERAQALARPLVQPEAKGDRLEILEFRLGEERYGLESRYVREVHPLKELTPLPCTPAFVLGIVSVRGRVLPVLDLKKLFGLQEKGIADLHRIILLRGNDLELGLLADVIVGVRSIPVEGLQPTLPTVTGIGSEYLKGVTAERLVVLDIDRVLEDPKIIVHEEVEA